MDHNFNNNFDNEFNTRKKRNDPTTNFPSWIFVLGVIFILTTAYLIKGMKTRPPQETGQKETISLASMPLDSLETKSGSAVNRPADQPSPTDTLSVAEDHIPSTQSPSQPEQALPSNSEDSADANKKAANTSAETLPTQKETETNRSGKNIPLTEPEISQENVPSDEFGNGSDTNPYPMNVTENNETVSSALPTLPAPVSPSEVFIETAPAASVEAGQSTPFVSTGDQNYFPRPNVSAPGGNSMISPTQMVSVPSDGNSTAPDTSAVERMTATAFALSFQTFSPTKEIPAAETSTPNLDPQILTDQTATAFANLFRASRPTQTQQPESLPTAFPLPIKEEAKELLLVAAPQEDPNSIPPKPLIGFVDLPKTADNAPQGTLSETAVSDTGETRVTTTQESDPKSVSPSEAVTGEVRRTESPSVNTTDTTVATAVNGTANISASDRLLEAESPKTGTRNLNENDSLSATVAVIEAAEEERQKEAEEANNQGFFASVGKGIGSFFSGIFGNEEPTATPTISPTPLPSATHTLTQDTAAENTSPVSISKQAVTSEAKTATNQTNGVNSPAVMFTPTAVEGIEGVEGAALLLPENDEPAIFETQAPQMISVPQKNQEEQENMNEDNPSYVTTTTAAAEVPQIYKEYEDEIGAALIDVEGAEEAPEKAEVPVEVPPIEFLPTQAPQQLSGMETSSNEDEFTLAPMTIEDETDSVSATVIAVYPTPAATALPQTGFAEDMNLPLLIAGVAALVSVIFVSRFSRKRL